ncbi:MAG TPA: hypothetical protein PKM97_05090 [Bacteroidia bacterium]|nr:hypothetical protein [Bacteroidia bacterium]
MKRFFETIDTLVHRLEKKWGLFLPGLLIGLIVLGLAALFTTPRWELFYHGKGFARLSMAPFDLSVESSLRYRILAPVLGYVLFLKGELFKYLMLGFLAAFLVLLYYFHRKKGFSPANCIGITMLLSFSTLSFYQLHFPGYSDPVSYVLILIVLFYKDRRNVVMTCLTLLLFNHDNTVFLFPFFFIFLLGNEYKLTTAFKTFLLFVPAVLLYASYRSIINSVSEVDFNTSYYFDPENLRWTRDRVSEHLAEGIFQAFRLGWVLPILAMLLYISKRNFKDVLILIVGFVFIASQFFIAYDISRLMGLAFPLIILSAWTIRDAYGTKIFNNLTWTLVFINLFIPSLCIGALEPIPYPPFWWPGLRVVLFGA